MNKHRSYKATAFFILGIVLTLASFASIQHHFVATKPLPPRHLVSVITVQSIDPEKSDAELSMIVHNPLVPHGLHSVAELKAQINRDPELAEYYREAGLDLSCVQQDTLAKSIYATVSYRSGNSIAMSRKPVLLVVGEQVIRDCHGVTIRMACGNLVGVIDRTPEQPDVVQMPIGVEITQPDVELAQIPETEAFNTPSAPITGNIGDFGPPPSGYTPIIYGGGSTGGNGGSGGSPMPPSKPTTPVKTPEPELLPMLIGALMALLIFVRFRKKP